MKKMLKGFSVWRLEGPAITNLTEKYFAKRVLILCYIVWGIQANKNGAKRGCLSPSQNSLKDAIWAFLQFFYLS